MNLFRRWSADRRRADEQAVVNAIRMLRPSRASGWPISRLAGIGVGRTYPALARLEASGVLVSEWSEGPRPRRRVYRLASAQVAR